MPRDAEAPESNPEHCNLVCRLQSKENLMRKRTQAVDTDAVIADAASIFETAEDQRGLPPPPDLKRGFNEIVRRVFSTDLEVVKEYETIEGALSISVLSPQAISRAANQSEDMARRAYRLYIVGKVEYESYMRATEALVAVIRDAAMKKLELEKASGLRTKQITDADVLAYCASIYADEWEDIMSRRNRAKGMLGYLEQLSDLSKKRCFTVARMLSPNGEL